MLHSNVLPPGSVLGVVNWETALGGGMDSIPKLDILICPLNLKHWQEIGIVICFDSYGIGDQHDLMM